MGLPFSCRIASMICSSNSCLRHADGVIGRSKRLEHIELSTKLGYLLLSSYLWTFLAVVFTVWSSKVYILPRACWWGPNKAEARPRLLGFAQRHFIWVLIIPEIQMTSSNGNVNLWQSGIGSRLTKVALLLLLLLLLLFRHSTKSPIAWLLHLIGNKAPAAVRDYGEVARA